MHERIPKERKVFYHQSNFIFLRTSSQDGLRFEPGV